MDSETQEIPCLSPPPGMHLECTLPRFRVTVYSLSYLGLTARWPFCCCQTCALPQARQAPCGPLPQQRYGLAPDLQATEALGTDPKLGVNRIHSEWLFRGSHNSLWEHIGGTRPPSKCEAWHTHSTILPPTPPHPTPPHPTPPNPTPPHPTPPHPTPHHPPTHTHTPTHPHTHTHTHTHTLRTEKPE